MNCEMCFRRDAKYNVELNRPRIYKMCGRCRDIYHDFGKVISFTIINEV